MMIAGTIWPVLSRSHWSCTLYSLFIRSSVRTPHRKQRRDQRGHTERTKAMRGEAFQLLCPSLAPAGAAALVSA